MGKVSFLNLSARECEIILVSLDELGRIIKSSHLAF